MFRLKKLIHPSGKYNKNYLNYVGWSFISNTVASIQQTLVAHNMLLCINTNSSTEIVRTMNYVGKDIIGQLGSLGYMAKMANNADKNPNKFLAYSNISQQTSYIITCITPIMEPKWFLPVAGGANIMSNISFAGFGAINAKCISTLSEGDNVGEIYAKIAVINTLGSSLGMVMGISIVALVPECGVRLCLIPILGVLRILTFNRAVKGII